MTGFVMIGQHMFVPPEDWSQERVFKDIKKWVNDGLGIVDEEITFHEDAWAGGGNFGPCMEFFSRGVEIGNQVYMLYEQTPEGPQELKLKVLDMGMGQERCAWFSLGTPTMYDATYGKLIEDLKKQAGIKYDKKLFNEYAKLSGVLNLDDIADLDTGRKMIAKQLGMNIKQLKEGIEPIKDTETEIKELEQIYLQTINNTA